MNNFTQPGDTLTLTAPTGGVTSGTGVIIGDLFVVAAITAAAGASFSGLHMGVTSLAKTSTDVWIEGDKLYWDNTNKRLDKNPSVGPLVAIAVAAAANPTSTGTCRLIGGRVQGSGVVGSGPAQASINTAGNATYTAAQLLGGCIVRDPNGAARSDTLPTAALLVAAMPGAKVGDVIRCHIVNGADAAEVLTILAGAGGTFDANQTAASQIIGQNTSKDIWIRLTNVTAASEAYAIAL